jgi:ribonucleoside-diphosphate reductase alpha chain
MVGGGAEKLVCGSVRAGLRALGYQNDGITRICNHLTATGTMVDSELDIKDLPVFDTAAESGGRCISPDGHMLMMAAIQPLITCAQSKTVNLPNSVTPKEIGDIYMRAWELGIKCIALYRDGCKASQPMSTKKEEVKADPDATEKSINQADVKTLSNLSDMSESQSAETMNAAVSAFGVPKRRRLPIDCTAKRHRFDISGHKGYIIVSEYADGAPGEVFMELGKEGSTMSGLLDGFTKLLSLSLQYGTPLEKLISGFAGMRFEPCGITDNAAIRSTSSIFDYLVRWLAQHYLTGEGQPHQAPPAPPAASAARHVDVDAPPCSSCGSMTQRNGRCYVCITCGTSSGCS